MPEGEADKLTVLLQCDTEWHAESIANGLRARGFAAQAEGGYVAGFRADVPAKARVMVFMRDVLPARLALSEMRTEASSIDWDTVNVGEHVEGVPEPVARIGPPAAETGAGGASRTRGWLITVLLMVVAVVALTIVNALRGRIG